MDGLTALQGILKAFLNQPRRARRCGMSSGSRNTNHSVVILGDCILLREVLMILWFKILSFFTLHLKSMATNFKEVTSRRGIKSIFWGERWISICVFQLTVSVWMWRNYFLSFVHWGELKGWMQIWRPVSIHGKARDLGSHQPEFELEFSFLALCS